MARLGVRGTFSQPGPSRPAAAVRLARTLGRTSNMLRLLAATTGIPFVLVAILAMAMDLHGGRLGSLTGETFELGFLPVVLLVLLFGFVLFVPGIELLSSRAKLSVLSVTGVGFLSALLPVAATALLSTWPVVWDSKRRLGFRIEHLADSILSGYPWLILGSVGGLLFWVLAIAGNRVFSHRLTQPP